MINENNLKNLKGVLIGFTLINIAFFIFIFFYDTVYYKLVFNYHIDWIFGLFHYMVLGVFLWIIWKKFPYTKKKKRDLTWLILLLGVLGLWLWFPNKKEIERMQNNNEV